MSLPDLRPPDPLGARVDLFVPSRANVYAGYILAGLFALAGLALLMYGLRQIPLLLGPPNDPTDRKDAMSALVFGLLLGFLIMGAGYMFGLVAWSLAGGGVEVCENGFRAWPAKPGSFAVLWSGVAWIEERFVREHIPAGYGGLLIPRKVMRQLAIVFRDGHTPFVWDRENFTGVGRLAKRLRAAADAHAIPWLAVQPD